MCGAILILIEPLTNTSLSPLATLLVSRKKTGKTNSSNNLVAFLYMIQSIMKKAFVFLFGVFPSIVFAQLGVSYHQSGLPFVGVNYSFQNKLRVETRVGADNYLNNLSLEGVITYDLLKKEEYEFYAGLGGRANVFPGLVVPIGLNFYPFEKKQFGFNIELAPIFGKDDLLRGSWGIRYRFMMDN